MIDIDGKQVLDGLVEIADPGHTALLIVDMQRDFVERDGAFGRLGVDVRMYEQMRPRLASLLQAARNAGVLVAHIQMSMLPHRRSDSPAQIRFNLRMHESFHRRQAPLEYTLVGSRGQEFVDDVTPIAGELLLRSNAIQSVIVTGCTTEGCVESTARDAMFNDYYVVVAEDCVASDDPAQHEASLLLMRHRFDVATGPEIARAWGEVRNAPDGDGTGADREAWTTSS